MIQITPQMRVLVAIEPIDGRKGIDALVRLCQDKLAEDPFSGCVFIFRSRRGTAIRLLSYDGQGYWLAQKRLSKGRFVWWPEGVASAKPLEAYEAQLLMAGRRCIASARRSDVATRECTQVRKNSSSPLRSRKTKFILLLDGTAQVPRPGSQQRGHPLYKGPNRGEPGGEPPHAVPETV
jgi:transposase